MADYDVAVHNSRVFTDSGQVPDNITTDRYVRLLKQANLWDSCVFFGDTARGVKKDTNQYVSKVYDLKANADLIQATGTAQPKYNADGSLLYDGGDHMYTGSVSASISEAVNNLTVCGWIKNSSLVSIQYLLSRYSTTGDKIFGINVHSTGKMRFFIFNNSDVVCKNYESASNITVGQWIYYAFTFSSNSFKIYINGIEEVPSIKTVDLAITSLKTSTEKIALGGLISVETYKVTSGGQTALPQIYNSTLTAEQILWNYNNIRPEGA
jgi:hypothetical protein